MDCPHDRGFQPSGLAEFGEGCCVLCQKFMRLDILLANQTARLEKRIAALERVVVEGYLPEEEDT